MKPSQRYLTCNQALHELRPCLIALLVFVFGIQTGTAASLDLQAPKSEPQPVTVDEDGDAEETDSAPNEDNPENDADTVENENDEPTTVPPGYAAGTSFSPEYQSNGFRPVNPEGQPVFGPTFNPNLARDSDDTNSDPDDVESTGDETPDSETAKAPGPVERPLPPDPGAQYDALLLQKQTGAPAVRQ